MSTSKPETQIGPPAPPYFYLSHARAEDELLVRRFFNDLSDSVRIQAKLPNSEAVGRYTGSDVERDEGLRTSRVLVALLSPAYFRDEAAGREWQIFEMRKAKTTVSETKAVTRSIIPICWSPHSGRVPIVVSKTRIFGLNGVPCYEPLATILRSRVKLKEYAEFVNSLADYIVDTTASFQLPELDSIPDEVSNAFEEQHESGMNSQGSPSASNQPSDRNVNQVNQNLFFIDGTFIRRIAKQIEELEGTPIPGPTIGLSKEPTQPRKAANEKYLVFAIDDEPEDMKNILATAGFSRDFDVKGYENSNQLLKDVSSLLENRQEPDLVVLNPELIITGTHRFRLIDALLEKKVPSAILAISKDPDAGSSLRSAGIKDLVAVLPKPFTSVDLLQRMRHWAKIGRDKRFRRGRSDERPVFVSYSSQNAAMASKLCNWLELREIGVWYSVEFLEAGDPWQDKVAEGLAQAKVFIPLISDNYPRSPYCHGELGNILDRLQTEADDLRVIPVLYNPSSATLEDPQIKACLNQQAVEISDRDWVPGFQQILLSVQKSLSRHKNQS